MHTKSPIHRPEAYDLYWYFAAERQAIFERRYHGQSAPWTGDPILNEYKFCNVFRATDRISQHLIRDVIYSDDKTDPVDKLFQIVLFRTFSKIETWEAILDTLGRPPLISDLLDDKLTRILDDRRETNQPIYTSAFILCANDAYSQGIKHRNHIEMLRDMFVAHDLATDIMSASSLRIVYDLLHSYPLMGDFMSYQIAVDLNYSAILRFDENDFTKAGPGALRGMRKCFISLGGYSPEDIIMYMVNNQEKEFRRLGLDFNGLFGRRLHAIDCQGLFCETDKYCRVALPELASARSRIKAKYTDAKKPSKLFLPPKWQLNNNI